jgi:chromosome segregation ATPase
MKLRFIHLALAAVIALGFASCKDKEAEQEATNQKAIAAATREELQQAINDRDELLSLVDEINQGLNQIKSLEKIANTSSAETPDRKAEVRNNIQLIQETLKERQARLEQLEKRLSSSNLNNKTLQQTIAGLKEQIASQTAEIDRLQNELSSARNTISQLGSQVDTLNAAVSAANTKIEVKEQENTALQNEMNRCYYVIATNKELKEHKIIEKSFLSSTKTLKGNYDSSFFTTGDKRTLERINLHSNKAKVWTDQPKDSYTIVDENGQKVLKITNKDAFWKLSDYLVIQID